MLCPRTSPRAELPGIWLVVYPLGNYENVGRQTQQRASTRGTREKMTTQTGEKTRASVPPVPLEQSRRRWWKSTYKGQIYRHPKGEIVHDDALNCLTSLRDECADIVFLDPPFNLGKSYGKNGSHHDRKKESEYVAYMAMWNRGTHTIIPQGAA